MLPLKLLLNTVYTKAVLAVTLGNPLNKSLAKNAAKKGAKNAVGDVQSVAGEMNKFVHGIVENPMLSLVSLIILCFLIFAFIKARTLLDRQRAKNAHRGRRAYMREAQAEIRRSRAEAQKEYEDDYDRLNDE